MRRIRESPSWAGLLRWSRRGEQQARLRAVPSVNVSMCAVLYPLHGEPCHFLKGQCLLWASFFVRRFPLGVALSFVIGPTELIKCKMQSGSHTSILKCIKDVYRTVREHHCVFPSAAPPFPNVCSVAAARTDDALPQEGVRGFGRGFGATVCREVPGNIVFFATYEGLQVCHHPWPCEFEQKTPTASTRTGICAAQLLCKACCAPRSCCSRVPRVADIVVPTKQQSLTRYTVVHVRKISSGVDSHLAGRRQRRARRARVRCAPPLPAQHTPAGAFTSRRLCPY